MADPTDRQRTNDPVTAPAAEDETRRDSAAEGAAPRGSAAEGRTTEPRAEDRLPRQSEVTAEQAEAASRKRAKESGRTMAKLFGIGLVVLVLVVLLAGFFGGDDEPTAAETVGAEPAD